VAAAAAGADEPLRPFSESSTAASTSGTDGYRVSIASLSTVGNPSRPATMYSYASGSGADCGDVGDGEAASEADLGAAADLPQWSFLDMHQAMAAAFGVASPAPAAERAGSAELDEAISTLEARMSSIQEDIGTYLGTSACARRTSGNMLTSGMWRASCADAGGAEKERSHQKSMNALVERLQSSSTETGATASA